MPTAPTQPPQPLEGENPQPGERRTDPGAHPNMTTAMEFDETLEAVK